MKKDKLGGICLNWGCIPTKALLKSAEYMRFLGESKEFGFEIPEVNVNFDQVVLRSRKVSERMSNGIGFLFKKHKVNSLKGNAVIKSGNSIELTDNSGRVVIEEIKCKNIIVATGARPRMINGIDVDHKKNYNEQRSFNSKESSRFNDYYGFWSDRHRICIFLFFFWN